MDTQTLRCVLIFFAQIFLLVNAAPQDEVFDDIADDFDFYDEFGFDDDSDLLFETAVPTLPKKPLLLTGKLYLDPQFVEHHKSYADATAMQAASQAALMLNYDSLDIRINFKIEGEPFRIDQHLEPSSNGLKDFDKHIADSTKAPDGSPYVHILMTTSSDRRSLGIARRGSICSSTTKALVIVKHINNNFRLAITLAHEIGHVLGMHHDFTDTRERSKCAEDRFSGKTIMNYGEPRNFWSACSNKDIRNMFNLVVQKKGKFCLNEDGQAETEVTGPDGNSAS